jgi:hypothetical protein
MIAAIKQQAQQEPENVEENSKSLWSRLLRGRFGFRIDENMSGMHRFEPGCGPEGYHPFEFTVTWGPDNLVDWLNPLGKRFMWQEMEGKVRVGGLCDWTPCRGTLELKYFDEHRIRYTFEFELEGQTYRFVGEKVNIQLWNLPVSHTTCFGSLTEKQSGKLISTSLTFFHLNRSPEFMRSLRLH